MARWIDVGSKTAPDGMKGTIDYDQHGSSWTIEQDEKPFIEQAKLDRELMGTNPIDGMRKFATIPDIVAIEINEKYGIDLHAPETVMDRDKMNRFKQIVRQEYAHLLSFQEVHMATYAETVTRVRDWSNRDATIVSDALVGTALQWGADRIYKQLRIPPLENTETFTITSADLDDDNQANGYQVLTMPIPEDMIEPIFIRRPEDGTTYNNRLDRRTLYDRDADRLVDSFTQIGDEYKLLGRFEVGDVIELHYYRRLPALNATYTANAANYNAGGGVGAITAGRYVRTATSSDTSPVTLFLVGTTAYDTQAAAEAVGTYTLVRVVGNEVVHWLRDENERMLMYAALVEVFNYLDEEATMTRYVGLMQDEIEKLNNEQMRRFAMGGNVRVSYTAGGLL